jgi:hypothetical protein
MSKKHEVEKMLKPGFADSLVALDPAYKPTTRVSKKIGNSAAELEA